MHILKGKILKVSLDREGTKSCPQTKPHADGHSPQFTSLLWTSVTRCRVTPCTEFANIYHPVCMLDKREDI